MVESVENPRPERMHLKENAFLPKLIQLRVTIEKASRNELVKDPYHKRGKKSKKYIVEGQGPRFEDDFARKGVLERILCRNGQQDGCVDRKDGNTQNCVIYNAMFL